MFYFFCDNFHFSTLSQNSLSSFSSASLIVFSISSLFNFRNSSYISWYFRMSVIMCISLFVCCFSNYNMCDFAKLDKRIDMRLLLKYTAAKMNLNGFVRRRIGRQILIRPKTKKRDNSLFVNSCMNYLNPHRVRILFPPFLS